MAVGVTAGARTTLTLTLSRWERGHVVGPRTLRVPQGGFLRRMEESTGDFCHPERSRGIFTGRVFGTLALFREKRVLPHPSPLPLGEGVALSLRIRVHSRVCTNRPL